MGQLTTAKVRQLNTPGRYGDGRGLYLVVKPSGTKSWIQRLTIDGKRTDKGLGGYPTYGLSEVRRTAESNRVAIQQGRNPWADGSYRPVTVEPSDIPTFQETAIRFHEVNLAAGGWTGKRTAKDWIGRVRKHIFPVVGSRQIDLITAQEIRDKVLLPVSAKHPETARRLRDSLNQIFVFAQESEWVDQNPIDKIPRRRLPRPAPVHHEALAWVEIPQLAAEIDVNTTDMRRSTRECLMFTLLTAARSGEARGATWREISDDLVTISKWPDATVAGTTGAHMRAVTHRGSSLPSCRTGPGPHGTWRAMPASVPQPTGAPDTACRQRRPASPRRCVGCAPCSRVRRQPHGLKDCHTLCPDTGVGVPPRWAVVVRPLWRPGSPPTAWHRARLLPQPQCSRGRPLHPQGDCAWYQPCHGP